jgi:hypothetical protein
MVEVAVERVTQYVGALGIAWQGKSKSSIPLCCEILGNNRRQSQPCRLELGLCLSRGFSRAISIADAHRDAGKRFVVRADERLTAFLELEAATRGDSELQRIGLTT